MTALAPVTAALPTRKDEAWRYSDLAALADVWPQAVAVERSVTVAAGAAGRLDEALAGNGWRNDRVVVSVGAGASLTGFIDQGGDADAVTTQLYDITLAAGARASIVILNHGGRFGRIALDVALHDGADFELGGIIIGGGAQNLEIITTVRHLGPGATSRQVVRCVVGGRAVGSYLGKVAVARAGQKTDAAQSFKALLLARGATANAKPELEIFADDVKCAHGATVGELDKTALFYLESRGVPPVQAQALLTRAFLSDALAGMADEDAREAVEDRVTALLEATS
jgi:Fe-S cluster assembly protein SufD